MIKTINPATGKIITSYPLMSLHEVAAIIDKTQQAFLIWSTMRLEERSQCFNKAAQLLSKNKYEYARLITMEMGKPIQSAEQEIEKCALTCRYFAKIAKKYLAEESIKTEMNKSYVTYQPLGIIFAIMPWNFPFWQVFRYSAPALMAGNASLLKHAPITTGCAIAIENIFKTAGFPENLLRAAHVDNNVAEKIIQHPKIAAITLTGSLQTGKKVGALAGGAIKKIVLELGGNDPYLILADADLELAANAVVTSRMQNAGQSCIAAKRILAVQAIREKFQHLVLEKLAQYKMGDPLDANVNLGPLAREDLRNNLDQQIKASVKLGAKIIQGGEIPKQPGFYYPPTVLVNVKPSMPAYTEELFGPVITFIDVADTKEALAIANDTPFGLGAAVFTQNLIQGEQIARSLNAGSVFINDFVRSDARLPFGGIKESGFGRELASEGIKEFVNIKTIAIK